MDNRNNYMFRKLLILLALLPVMGSSAQVCSGDFTWLQNGLTMTYYGTTSPNITGIGWDFGDGNYDFTNTANPSHTYAAPGVYNVCILYTDSATCADSTCHTLVLDSCYGMMSYYVNGGTVSFYGTATDGGPNTVYQWNFGDNGTSSMQNPVHTYTNPGTYTVCFAFYDLATGCSDSICQPITVGGCNAEFTWVDSMGYVFFINQSTPGNTGSYTWDFGDGNYSWQYAPIYQYAFQGVYQVCLTALDSNSNFCDSTCHWISIMPQVGMQEASAGIFQVTLAPNPSDEAVDLSFRLDQPGEVHIRLFDLSGRMVKALENIQAPAGQQHTLVETKELSEGTYLIQMHVNGHVSTNRLVVSHKL